MYKLGIIVPYRNREEQLERFKEEIVNFLDNNLNTEYSIIVVDQADKKPFNRGKLLNIGFLEAKNQGCDYVVFHDIDMIPIEADYTYSDKPLQLANNFLSDGEFKRTIQRNYFGGVTMFSVKDFTKINGYSNRYKGWGFEDDDLLLRCRENKLELETERYRTVSLDKKLIKFNGKNSYIQIDNKYVTVRPYSYVATFFPRKIECDPSEITDEYTVFGIPGHDLSLSFNSFSNYKFELFTKDNSPVSVYSDYMPNLPLQVVVNINPGLNRVQYFINGKEIETMYWGEKSMRNYKSEPFLYLGVAEPTRKIKQKYFNGYISNFGIIHGELSLGETKKLFTSNPNERLTDTNEFLQGRWYAYYDSIDYSKLKNIVKDTSGRFNHGVLHNCTIEHVSTTKVTRLEFPYRRPSTFQLIKHEEAGYTDGFWKDWSSRENQLRYYRKVNNKSTEYEKDGLTTCTYRERSRENVANYTKLNVIT